MFPSSMPPWISPAGSRHTLEAVGHTSIRATTFRELAACSSRGAVMPPIVAISMTFGQCALEGFRVWTDEFIPSASN